MWYFPLSLGWLLALASPNKKIFSLCVFMLYLFFLILQVFFRLFCIDFEKWIKTFSSILFINNKKDTLVSFPANIFIQRQLKNSTIIKSILFLQNIKQWFDYIIQVWSFWRKIYFKMNCKISFWYLYFWQNW